MAVYTDEQLDLAILVAGIVAKLAREGNPTAEKIVRGISTERLKFETISEVAAIKLLEDLFLTNMKPDLDGRPPFNEVDYITARSKFESKPPTRAQQDDKKARALFDLKLRLEATLKLLAE